VPSDEHYARLRNRADAAVADGSADAPRLAADAVAWCRRHLAADDPELAWALVRQAQTVPDQVVETGGRVTYRFVLLFEEALGILRKAHGPRSEPVADALASFAGLLSPRDPVAAVAPLRERLTVLRSLRGPAPPDVGAAACVLAQALSHAAQTLRNEAAAQYRASLDVWARQPASPWTAAAWSGWGELAAGAGDLDTADHAYRQAVEVARNLASGPDPALARHLPALAGIAVRRGRPDEAVPLWEEALSVQRAVSGDADPGVAATWFSLSLATAGARSLEASREALRAAGAWLETGAAADLDDRRRLAVLADPLRYADRHLAQLAALGSDAAEAVEAAAWRRRLPDLVSRPWRLSPARHPDERDLGAVLSEIATRHQERYQTARTDRGADASGRRFIGHALRLRQLRARRAELEARLRREAAVGRAARPLESGTLDAVRGTLTDDERFVDILRAGAVYVATVVAPGAKPPAVVGLGDAALIDQAALLARAAMEGPGRAAAFRDITPPTRVQAGADAADTLARLVVEPLLPHLDGCRRLRIAVDGALLHVPLGVLPAGSTPLLASCAVDYVTGADALADTDRTDAAGPGPDVVLAAPDYDLGRTGPAGPDPCSRRSTARPGKPPASPD
jgi:hypothetical protein